MNDPAENNVASLRKPLRIWYLILAAHCVAAAAWWWMMPGGFPVSHPRFWVNEALPPAIVAACVVAMIALRGERQDRLAAAVLAAPVAWTAALVAGCWLFPESRARFVLPAAGATAVAWLAYWPLRSALRRHGRATLAALAIGAPLGLFAPWSQRAPAADTRPADEPLPPAPPVEEGEQFAALALVSDRARVVSGDGWVSVRCGGLTIDVRPFITFESVSPDRCWTILAPPAAPQRSERRLTGLLQSEGQALLAYDADTGTQSLRVASASDGPTSIEAFTQLAKPVYSHLNSYCELTIRGAGRVSVEFSPCPQRIAIEPTDYPVGRPARFAYLDSGGAFNVVEARSGEKGPYRRLAAGPLGRSDALGLVLYDEDRPAARIVFEDWAGQVDPQLSPTAGWGVPVNAIEFSRSADAPGALVTLWLTLAGTSVGRGWDSVGHAAGVYRNRLRIEPAGP